MSANPSVPPEVQMGAESHAPPSAEEMNMMVVSMLGQMESNFAVMSSQVLDKIDQMALRINELEETVQNLMKLAGVTEEDVEEMMKKNREEREKKPEDANVMVKEEGSQ